MIMHEYYTDEIVNIHIQIINKYFAREQFGSYHKKG